MGEAVWLQSLLHDLYDNLEKPMVIHEDNQTAINMSKNQQYHGHAKHIDIKYKDKDKDKDSFIDLIKGIHLAAI